MLDACVLVPAALCDTLLRLADRDLYRPVWSDRILAEMRHAILEVHPGIDAGRVDARIRSMNAAFEDACVTGWEGLVQGIRLPDPDDRHVVAAALSGRADAILTANLKDFPADALEPLGLHAVSAEDFLLDQLDLDPMGTIELLREQARDKKRPPVTVEDVLSALGRAGAPHFADAVAALLRESGT